MHHVVHHNHDVVSQLRAKHPTSRNDGCIMAVRDLLDPSMVLALKFTVLDQTFVHERKFRRGEYMR